MAALVKLVWAEPSPQSTSTLHGASAPGSENDPRENGVEVPSSAPWPAGPVTVGATLVTSMSVVYRVVPPSLSMITALAVNVPLSG